MTYRIADEGCINCGWCRRACPTDTIRFFTTSQRLHVIEPEGCIDCAICQHVCPVDVIWHDTSYVPEPAPLEAAKAKARAWAGGQRQLRERRRRRAASIAGSVRARRAG